MGFKGVYITRTCFRDEELISKFNVGLKALPNDVLSEPEFCGDLVNKFKSLIGKNDVASKSVLF